VHHIDRVPFDQVDLIVNEILDVIQRYHEEDDIMK